MHYVINDRDYWTARVGQGWDETVPMQDDQAADYYVIRSHPSLAAGICVGYIARVSSGAWRAYDDKGAPVSDQEHREMALCDVAISIEVPGAAAILAARLDGTLTP